MNSPHLPRFGLLSFALGVALSGASAFCAAAIPPPPAPAVPATPNAFPDQAGTWANFSLPGATDRRGPFFQSLGSNGRTCASCHAGNDAWTATPAQLQRRFADSNGTDPVFAAIDGTNCPTLNIQTPLAHAAASSMLLGKGLIRVEMPVPASAEFAVSNTSNRFGCTSTTALSVYRRIPMSANLSLLSEVMWDGRASATGQSVSDALRAQASDAVTDHAAAVNAPSSSILQAIFAFEIGQFTAQSADRDAGSLTAAGAKGGPTTLSGQSFALGANEPFKADGSGGVPPNPVFSLYTAWRSLTGSDAVSQARASIARGEQIFNTRPVSISGVAGLNDLPGPNGLPRTVIQGTCGTCHNTPNGGGHSTPLNLNIGIANTNRAGPDLPVFTLISKATGRSVQTTDPGRALVTGKWADIGKFKVPTLRGLAARAPYFHNGTADNVGQVVGFYDRRFNLNLSAQERADLVAFLESL
jgi:cytochrome c peroxidase